MRISINLIKYVYISDQCFERTFQTKLEHISHQIKFSLRCKVFETIKQLLRYGYIS
jgi:hypothetical protein